MGHDGPMLILGHRGASAAAPENTTAAFALADEMGADGVELDVRITPDGRLLAVHDPLPLSLTEIDALDAPTFAEVLDACGERLLINVEIKNWPEDSWYDETMALVPPILDEMRSRGHADRWLISSFSLPTIDACRTYAPELATAWLTWEAKPKLIDKVLAGGHVAIHPWEPTVTAATVAMCHEAGVAINVWTCNDAARLVELAALGVDGVCTDVPDVARHALGRAADEGAVTPRWPAART